MEIAGKVQCKEAGGLAKGLSTYSTPSQSEHMHLGSQNHSSLVESSDPTCPTQAQHAIIV
jgi:hypothetical protein